MKIFINFYILSLYLFNEMVLYKRDDFILFIIKIIIKCLLLLN